MSTQALPVVERGPGDHGPPLNKTAEKTKLAVGQQFAVVAAYQLARIFK
ncbi:MAG TPA: hypothetical protein VN442_07720 [Bryobacteraceae bacterium]|nr:hypothetical protein [Bryobacteraceae bacterium]